MTPGPPCPTVLLLHRLPDGESHYDWMIAVDPAGRSPLVSYRLAGRPDRLAAGEKIGATAIGEHRPLYLDYEGPVSGGRGRVERVRRGRAIWVLRTALRAVVRVTWENNGVTGGSQEAEIEIKCDSVGSCTVFFLA
jgi:hypothetical protein